MNAGYPPIGSLMTTLRPTFTETIKAFTLTHSDFGVLHTEEEADVAEALRHVEAIHQGGDEPDGPDSATWGRCGGCGEPWPCPTWAEAEQLAVLYLGRAQDRVWAHASSVLDRLAERDRAARAAVVNGGGPLRA